MRDFDRGPGHRMPLRRVPERGPAQPAHPGLHPGHEHADHIFGMDELRTFNFVMGRPIPVYGSEKVINRLSMVFSYVWDPGAPKGGGLPLIQPHTINGKLDLCGMDITPVHLLHGDQPILGFLFDKRAAYLTDCSEVPEESMELIRGVELAIIDGLRYRPHTTHMSVDQAVAVLEEIKPGRGLLTHLSHSLDYNRLKSELPDWIEPAYDGQVIELPEESA